jgi:hypothetical protein
MLMTPHRRALAEAIKLHREWARHCANLDDQLAAKEASVLEAAAQERREAEKALEQARMVTPQADRRALQTLLGTPTAPVQTVAEAQAALDAVQARHDTAYSQVSQAKREAAHIRNTSLAAATRQRDDAVRRSP